MTANNSNHSVAILVFLDFSTLVFSTDLCFWFKLGFQSKVIFVSLIRENLHVKLFTGVITKEKLSRQSLQDRPGFGLATSRTASNTQQAAEANFSHNKKGILNMYFLGTSFYTNVCTPRAAFESMSLYIYIYKLQHASPYVLKTSSL